MNTLSNHQIRLAARPTGLPKPTDWQQTVVPVQQPGHGQLLVKTLYISLDPGMRVWMNEGDSYVKPVNVGDVMRAGCIAKVVASQHPDFAVDELVVGRFGVQEFAISDGKDMIGHDLVKIGASKVPLEHHLGVLGIPGLTAYFGLLDVGRPLSGQTLVVSGATGAVGSVVGQLGKLKGCRVIGIAGGEAKCRFLLDDLHFDGAVDYQAENMTERLAELCPDGVDVYFDNVGGDVLDAVLGQLAMRARIVLCGSMSQYSTAGPVQGPRNYRALLIKRARMEGMIVYDYANRYAEARTEMEQWIAQGKLVQRTEVIEGLDAFPDAILRMLRGDKLGKLLIKVSDA